MQLVEQGKLSLDDAGEVEKLLPEVGRAKVLKGFGGDGKPVLGEKKKGVTLRMLLSHTGEFCFFAVRDRKLGG
jgi:CubicO group peptidase (beta-lactamase class C family)